MKLKLKLFLFSKSARSDLYSSSSPVPIIPSAAVLATFSGITYTASNGQIGNLYKTLVAKNSLAKIFPVFEMDKKNANNASLSLFGEKEILDKEIMASVKAMNVPELKYMSNKFV